MLFARPAGGGGGGGLPLWVTHSNEVARCTRAASPPIGKIAPEASGTR